MLLTAVAAAAWTAACSAGGETPAQAAADRGGAAPPAVPVATAIVEQKSMPLALAVIGTAEASSNVAVRSQITGSLTSVNFKEGDDVTKGQVLFTLDRRPLEGALQQAQATLQRDMAQAAQAKSTAARFQDLQSRGIATKEQADQSRTAAAALEATLESDRAAVENAKVQLQYATIAAPISGRTGALIVDEGNLVRANDTTPLVVINQVAPIYVSFGIPEGRLPELRRYLAQGTVRVEATPPGETTTSSGRITFIDNAVDSTTGQIRIKAAFPNADRRLWPGQFANVDVTLEHRAQRDRRAHGRGPDRPAGELRVRREAGHDGGSAADRRSAAGRRSDRRRERPEAGRDRGDRRPAASGSGRQGEHQVRTRGRPAQKVRAMNLSALFIKRPVTTTLIMLGILVFGVMAYRLLPVSDLPVIDFPTIQVQAGLPGASPETMATSVALPLEKQFSAIAGLTSINSTSSLGTHQHHAAVRFEPQHRRGRAGRAGDDRADDPRAAAEHAGAAVAAEEQPDRSVGDVSRAAVADASAVDDRRVRADARSAHLDREWRLAGEHQRLAEGRRARRGGSAQARDARDRPRRSRHRHHQRERQPADRTMYGDARNFVVKANGQLLQASAFGPVIVAYRNGNPVRLNEVAHVYDGVENDKIAGWFKGERAITLAINKQPGTNVVQVVDGVKALLPTLQRAAAGGDDAPDPGGSFA